MTAPTERELLQEIRESLKNYRQFTTSDAVWCIVDDQMRRIDAHLAERPGEAVAKQSVKPARIRFTAPMLRAALDFVNPDGPKDSDQQEHELTIGPLSEHEDGPGLYAWFTEYPEDGSLRIDNAPATPAEPARGTVEVPVRALLAIRDALVADDKDEAFHQLYSAVPWQDPFNPWAEWDAMLAARNG